MSASVRAKFKVSQITKHDVGSGGVSETVKLLPVYGNQHGDANKDWSKYTPTGEITMGITLEGAVGKFELGKSYFVDFTPADA